MDNNLKDNPKTTVPGYTLMFIAFLMLIVKWILPCFIVLRKEPEYEWYVVLAIGAISIVLIFLNDQYFDKLFNRGDKYLGRITHTEDLKS